MGTPTPFPSSKMKPQMIIKADCVVIGGGPAGYGAALAAARGGCDTLLVERHGFLGGMGSAAGLGCFLNYHHLGRDLADTLYRELVDSMLAEGNCYRGHGGNIDLFDPEALKHHMERRFLQAGGRLLYHCLLSDVRRADDGLWHLEFAAKATSPVVHARYVIDCTGDADTCALAGAQMTFGRKTDGKTQPMSMVVQMGGFDPTAWSRAGHYLTPDGYAGAGDTFAEEIVRARAAGQWHIPRETISMVMAVAGDPTRIMVNGTRVQGLNACDPLEHTAAEIEGRAQARELVAFFRNYIPGFEHAYLLQTGPQIGVRETRRIVGRATLTEQDVFDSVVPDDTITLCAYPIDIHHPDGQGTDHAPHKVDYLYGISYGCLLPVGLENIAAAGRCISATHEAAGSFRVMPTCMSIGQAAGTAVAIARESDLTLGAVNGSDVRARMLAPRLAAQTTSP